MIDDGLLVAVLECRSIPVRGEQMRTAGPRTGAAPAVLAENRDGVWADYVSGVGLLSQETGDDQGRPTAIYVHADATGSVRLTTDDQGPPTGTAASAPFGAPVGGTLPSGLSAGFAGEWADSAGRLYLRARSYDTATGTFLTRDPLPGRPE